MAEETTLNGRIYTEIGATFFRRNMGKVVDDAYHNGTNYLVSLRGKPYAVVLGVDFIEGDS